MNNIQKQTIMKINKFYIILCDFYVFIWFEENKNDQDRKLPQRNIMPVILRMNFICKRLYGIFGGIFVYVFFMTNSMSFSESENILLSPFT